MSIMSYCFAKKNKTLLSSCSSSSFLTVFTLLKLVCVLPSQDWGSLLFINSSCPLWNVFEPPKQMITMGEEEA